MVNNNKSGKDKSKIFPKGAKCVFMGNSFFHPVATKFDELATKSGKYPNHSMQLFKSAGPSGFPDALWANKSHRTQIINMLSSKDIELFGMVCPLEINNDAMKVVKRWIDTALSYNSKTSIFMAQPWGRHPTRKDTNTYKKLMSDHGEMLFNDLITPLRSSYPNINIYFLNYGECSGELKSLFEKKKCDKCITKMTGRSEKDPESKKHFIYRDEIGHAGTYIEEMAAITWMSWFYNGVSLNKIGKNEKSKEKLKQLGWNVDNVNDVLSAVGDVSEKYRL